MPSPCNLPFCTITAYEPHTLFSALSYCQEESVVDSGLCAFVGAVAVSDGFSLVYGS